MNTLTDRPEPGAERLATGTLLSLPVRDRRMDDVAADPQPVAELLSCAIKRIDCLAGLVRADAPVAEIAAAAEVLARFRVTLAALEIGVGVFVLAREAGYAHAVSDGHGASAARRSRLSAVPCSNLAALPDGRFR